MEYNNDEDEKLERKRIRAEKRRMRREQKAWGQEGIVHIDPDSMALMEGVIKQGNLKNSSLFEKYEKFDAPDNYLTKNMMIRFHENRIYKSEDPVRQEEHRLNLVKSGRIKDVGEYRNNKKSDEDQLRLFRERVENSSSKDFYHIHKDMDFSNLSESEELAIYREAEDVFCKKIEMYFNAKDPLNLDYSKMEKDKPQPIEMGITSNMTVKKKSMIDYSEFDNFIDDHKNKKGKPSLSKPKQPHINNKIN
jgi:hypothetical protein